MRSFAGRDILSLKEFERNEFFHVFDVAARMEPIARARKNRKMLGGGMRQGGLMAAAGVVALRTMVDRLGEDHRRAAQLAEGLRGLPGVMLKTDRIETNMVFFDVAGMANDAFVDTLQTRGIRMGLLGEGVIRAVVHYMIDDAAIQATVAAAADILCNRAHTRKAEAELPA